MAGITRCALLRCVAVTVLTLAATSQPVASDSVQKAEAQEQHTRAGAERMIRAAEGRLAPVYAPLAEEIAERLGLAADKEGVGIDLGSGPGSLIVELCKRTKLHWVNADINAHFFPYFLARAEAQGCGGRVSAIRADACALPFRDDFADAIVSRGSLQFWSSIETGLREIHRVLKPGGVAYIGRGLPGRIPLEAAKQLRADAGEGPNYAPAELEQQLRKAMEALGIEDYVVHRPRLDNPLGVNYGVWLRFQKTRP